MMRLMFHINYYYITNIQVSRIFKAFANGSSANIKFSKTQLSRMVLLGGFLGRNHEQLLKTGLPLKKNVLKPLAKSVLIPLGLIASVSLTDVAIQKNIFGFGMHPSDSAKQTKLVILIKEMDGIIKIIKSFGDAELLVKSVSETIQK